jgi:hypothetical protein
MRNLKIPDIRQSKPRIAVFGVGGAGSNALNNEGRPWRPQQAVETAS